ncbi:hypothetical protein PPO43_05360 [Saprospira sp. CCB-QB6]|uniref:hypothetical protein n=1 Tax=Saprospira sp. CCB-QB6 TaxID=3023936 RepID=UPI00234BCF19|nr:hypothetical protein [Saprospira sp. CCB-QB6]WCL82526.1 hypothetical protein PPO43_05360 [Saprospira sp. CCB-QB6]
MKTMLRFCVLLISSSLLWACQVDPWEQAEEGYLFRFLEQASAEGLAPQFGDSICFSYSLVLPDSVQRAKRCLIYPVKEQRNFFLYPLAQMRTGDSLAVVWSYAQLAEEWPEGAEQFAPTDSVRVQYRLAYVLDRLSLKAKREQDYALAKGFVQVEDWQEERLLKLEQADSLETLLTDYRAAYLAQILNFEQAEEGFFFKLEGQGQGKAAAYWAYYILLELDNAQLLDNNLRRADRLPLEQASNKLPNYYQQAVAKMEVGQRGYFIFPESSKVLYLELVAAKEQAE